MRTIIFISTLLVLVVGLFFATQDVTANQEEQHVNLYYSGKEHLIRPLLDAFTKETDITVNVVTGNKSGLITRIEQEAEYSPADVLLTVDIGNIYQAKTKGLLKPVTSDILTAAIPAHLHGEDNDWFAVSLRTRALFYAKDRVKPEQLSTYEALAEPEWKGKLLVRSSNNVYNQSLMASLISHDGEAQALDWATSMVSNFARDPKGGDRDQIRAIAAGEGDIAIANSYYFGRMQNSKEASDIEAASKVGIFFPNQDGRGAHINIRGGGVVKHAKNTANAIKLLEYLVGDAAQAFFANTNYEFPVRNDVALPDTLRQWGEFTLDNIHLTKVGALNKEAVMTFDKAGWK